MRWAAPDKTKILADDRVTLAPLDVGSHGRALFRAASLESNGVDLFVYNPAPDPVTSEAEYLDYLTKKAAGPDLTYTITRSLGNEVVGSVSLLNTRPDHGVTEVGSVWYAKKAQRTEVNTHTMWLLFQHVFDELKYRRLEWKCHNENEASKNAALRLGFQYEGLFRQHQWMKGRNRDTAWYSIIDSDWPAVKQRFVEKLLRYGKI